MGTDATTIQSKAAFSAIDKQLKVELDIPVQANGK